MYFVCSLFLLFKKMVPMYSHIGSVEGRPLQRSGRKRWPSAAPQDHGGHHKLQTRREDVEEEDGEGEADAPCERQASGFSEIPTMLTGMDKTGGGVDIFGEVWCADL